MNNEKRKTIVLICGATRGLGREVARAIAAPDVHIIALARSRNKLESLSEEIELRRSSATLVPANLLDPGAITSLSESINMRWGVLHAVFDAVPTPFGSSPIHGTSLSQWQRCVDSALLAKTHLIGSMDPLLAASKEGRILITLPCLNPPSPDPDETDSEAETIQPFHGRKAVARACIEALIQTYARETESRSLRVNGIEYPSALNDAELAGICRPYLSKSCLVSGTIVGSKNP